MQVVRQRIPEVEFRTWFTNVEPLGFSDGSYVVAVQNSFARDWLKSRYSELLESSLKEIGAEALRFVFQVSPDKPSTQEDLFQSSDDPGGQSHPKAGEATGGKRGRAQADNPPAGRQRASSGPGGAGPDGRAGGRPPGRDVQPHNN